MPYVYVEPRPKGRPEVVPSKTTSSRIIPTMSSPPSSRMSLASGT